MIRFLFLLCAAALGFLPSPADADDGFYLGLYGGGGFFDPGLRYDTVTPRKVASDTEFRSRLGGTGGAVGGYRFGPLRAELDLGGSVFGVEARRQLTRLAAPRRSKTLTRKGTIYAPTGTANLLIDTPEWNAISAYTGVGVGASYLAWPGRDDVALTWQAQAGFHYGLTADWTVQVGYRFQRIEDTAIGDIDSHTGLVGVKFGF